MNKNFNSKRYADDFPVNVNEEIRIAQVLNLIGSGKTVLDLGCGDGFFMERIKVRNNVVIGVETADKAIEKARKKGFQVYDLLLEKNWSSEIKENFDVVFAGEIIEHIFDTDNFLQNIKNVLKDGGYLVITTPNIAALGRRLFLLLGKNPLLEITARVGDAGHIRYFTRETLKNLLIQNGFNVQKMISGVVNFSATEILSSKLLADFFPSIGNNIIVNAKK